MAFQPISGSGSGSGSNSGFQFFNSPFGDTTLTKVFVGGLAWETQSETMRRYFEQFGDILEAVVISDKNTRRSKGYGFVSACCFGCFYIHIIRRIGCAPNSEKAISITVLA